MLSVTDFVPKRIISGVRVQAGLHLDMLDADRSPNMQSAFFPELHRWISKLTARHLHACPPGDLLVVVVAVVFIYSRLLNRHIKKSTSRVPTGEGEGEGVAMSCGERGERRKYKHFKSQYGESLLTLTQRIAKG